MEIFASSDQQSLAPRERIHGNASTCRSVAVGTGIIPSSWKRQSEAALEALLAQVNQWTEIPNDVTDAVSSGEPEEKDSVSSDSEEPVTVVSIPLQQHGQTELEHTRSVRKRPLDEKMQRIEVDVFNGVIETVLSCNEPEEKDSMTSAAEETVGVSSTRLRQHDRNDLQRMGKAKRFRKRLWGVKRRVLLPANMQLQELRTELTHAVAEVSSDEREEKDSASSVASDTVMTIATPTRRRNRNELEFSRSLRKRLWGVKRQAVVSLCGHAKESRACICDGVDAGVSSSHEPEEKDSVSSDEPTRTVGSPTWRRNDLTYPNVRKRLWGAKPEAMPPACEQMQESRAECCNAVIAITSCDEPEEKDSMSYAGGETAATMTATTRRRNSNELKHARRLRTRLWGMKRQIISPGFPQTQELREICGGNAAIGTMHHEPEEKDSTELWTDECVVMSTQRYNRDDTQRLRNRVWGLKQQAVECSSVRVQGSITRACTDVTAAAKRYEVALPEIDVCLKDTILESVPPNDSATSVPAPVGEIHAACPDHLESSGHCSKSAERQLQRPRPSAREDRVMRLQAAMTYRKTCTTFGGADVFGANVTFSGLMPGLRLDLTSTSASSSPVLDAQTGGDRTSPCSSRSLSPSEADSEREPYEYFDLPCELETDVFCAAAGPPEELSNTAAASGSKTIRPPERVNKLRKAMSDMNSLSDCEYQARTALVDFNASAALVRRLRLGLNDLQKASVDQELLAMYPV